MMLRALMLMSTIVATSAVSGKCGGNDASATNLAEASTPAGTFQYACGAGYSLKGSPESIAFSGADAAAQTAVCCDAVAGKCGGNQATATDLAEASTPAGTFQYACGTGYSLKANPATIALSGADAAAKTAVCCDADPVAGKCGGNAATATDLAEASTPAGTFQYACGTGYSLKANPATIALSGADAAAKTAVCCDADVAGKCGGNAATATDLAEASTPAGTFQYACGTGYSLKANPATIDLSGADAAAKTAVCCDAVATTTPSPAGPATSPTTTPSPKKKPEPKAPAPAADVDASSTLSTGALALVVSLFAMAKLW